MIPIEYYTTTYYLLLSTVIFFTTFPFLTVRKIVNFPHSYLHSTSIVLLILCISFIGFRDPFASSIYLGDTSAYTWTFELIQKNLRTSFTKDIGFYLYMKFCSKFMSVQSFYLLSALLYVYLPFVSFQKLFGKNALFVLLLFITSMSFWAFGINGVRNGLATSIFIFALSFNDRKFLMYPLLLLSITFHNSMFLPVVAMLFTKFYSNTKVLTVFWLFTIPISLFFGSKIFIFVKEILAIFNLDFGTRTDLYLSETESLKNVRQSFRLDFIIYSVTPLSIAWWSIFRKKYHNKLYFQIVNTYLITNGIWILLIYMPYTNRVAYLSWFLMPLILAFPFIKNSIVRNNNRWIMGIIYFSLIFTLIMHFK